jgi:sugar lactone lactonase YvrE
LGILLVSLAVSAGGGQKAGEWRGVVTTENGVTVVKNPATPLFRESLVEFQEDFVIRDSDGGSKFQFVRPADLVLDRQNRLYIGDGRDRNIKVFDERGRFVRLIGKPGPGPGELGSLAGIAIRRDEIIVSDSSSRRVTVFDLEGNYRRSLPAPGSFGRLGCDSHGNFYVMTYVRGKEGNRHELQKFGPGLEPIKTFTSRAWRPPTLFQATDQFAIAPDDKIVYAFPETYELKVFDGVGTLVRKIRKDSTRERIPREVIDFVTRNGPGPGSFAVIPEFYEYFYGLELDEEGRMLVNTRNRSTGNRERTYDVFDPDGRFLATIALPYFSACLWANKKLYTIEEDAEGMPLIRVRRVSWTYPR